MRPRISQEARHVFIRGSTIELVQEPGNAHHGDHRRGTPRFEPMTIERR
jgi:hypothetical protein